MKSLRKNSNGKYVVNGHSFDVLIGSRAQVWHDTAYKTSGGLTKNDLIKNKAGRIVSKAKHHSAKKEQRLLKHGYGTKKGKFGHVKLNNKSRKGGRSRSSSRSQSGGFVPANAPLNAAPISGIKGDTSNLNVMVTNYGGRRRRRSSSRNSSRSSSRSQSGGFVPANAPLNASPISGIKGDTSNLNVMATNYN
jgi:hypothetical protein